MSAAPSIVKSVITQTANGHLSQGTIIDPSAPRSTKELTKELVQAIAAETLPKFSTDQLTCTYPKAQPMADVLTKICAALPEISRIELTQHARASLAHLDAIYADSKIAADEALPQVPREGHLSSIHEHCVAMCEQQSELRARYTLHLESPVSPATRSEILSCFESIYLEGVELEIATQQQEEQRFLHEAASPPTLCHPLFTGGESLNPHAIVEALPAALSSSAAALLSSSDRSRIHQAEGRIERSDYREKPLIDLLRYAALQAQCADTAVKLLGTIGDAARPAQGTLEALATYPHIRVSVRERAEKALLALKSAKNAA